MKRYKSKDGQLITVTRCNGFSVVEFDKGEDGDNRRVFFKDKNLITLNDWISDWKVIS